MAILKRIGGFFRETWRSCYDMEYYRNVRTQSVGKSIGYAASFHLMIVLLTMILVLPGIFSLKGAVLSALGDSLPDGTEFVMEKGSLRTSLDEPHEFSKDEKFTVVVDTSHEGTAFPDGFGEPGMFVGRNAVFTMDEDKQLRSMPYTDVPDFTVTKEQAMSKVEKGATPLILLLALAFTAMYWVFFMAWTSLTVAVYSLIALVAGKIGKVRLSYSQWFATGLHAVTLPILASGLLAAMNARIPFVYFALYFLLVAAVIVDERNQPTAGAPSAPVPPAAPDAPKPPQDQPPTIPPTAE